MALLCALAPRTLPETRWPLTLTYFAPVEVQRLADACYETYEAALLLAQACQVLGSLPPGLPRVWDPFAFLGDWGHRYTGHNCGGCGRLLGDLVQDGVRSHALTGELCCYACWLSEDIAWLLPSLRLVACDSSLGSLLDEDLLAEHIVGYLAIEFLCQ